MIFKILKQLILLIFLLSRRKLTMIPANLLDRAISNIKYRLGICYVRMGLTPSPTIVRICKHFSNPHPRDPYVINEWPLPMQFNNMQPQKEQI